MRIQAALLREQGVEFASVVVRSGVVRSPGQREGVQQALAPLFPSVPVVLMEQDAHGVPTFWGRPDLVRFLAHVPVEAMPWKEYAVN